MTKRRVRSDTAITFVKMHVKRDGLDAKRGLSRLPRSRAPFSNSFEASLKIQRCCRRYLANLNGSDRRLAAIHRWPIRTRSRKLLPALTRCGSTSHRGSERASFGHWSPESVSTDEPARSRWRFDPKL